MSVLQLLRHRSSLNYRSLHRIDIVDLEQIFDPQLELDSKTANEGRREVLSHLQNDVNNRTTQDKKCSFTFIDFGVANRVS